MSFLTQIAAKVPPSMCYRVEAAPLPDQVDELAQAFKIAFCELKKSPRLEFKVCLLTIRR
jgi:hypothetical protein